jgi:LysM repeat protein
MICFHVARRCAIGLLLCLFSSGCFPSTDSQSDEQKEPHFLTGKARVSSLDYQGAVESFEQALEVNPHSASAHFELAWLYEDKLPDAAVAIYHYQCFLKLKPNSDNADLVKNHINICKQQLATSIAAIGPSAVASQHQVEKLTLENKDLKNQLAQWRAYYESHPQVVSNTPAVNPTPPAKVETGTATTAGNRQTHESPPVQTARLLSPKAAALSTAHPATPAAGRTHTIKSGESPYIIAKQYGVSVNALLAANPQARPTKLQVGQVLNIPTP